MSFFQEDMSGVSHDRMVELAQMRNHEAFTILFQYHRSGVYKYAASLVGNDQDAQDPGGKGFSQIIGRSRPR